jgi:hypothetical protein
MLPSLPICDCGSPADKRDSTGWSCALCRAMIKRVQFDITEMICQQRQLTGESIENKRRYQANYMIENRERVLAYQRNYHAQKRLQLQTRA